MCTYTYVYLYMYSFEKSGLATVRASVRLGVRSRVGRVRVGALVSTPKRGALPVGVDRMWLRRAGIPTVVVQCEHRRVEHRTCYHIFPGMRRCRPGVAPRGNCARVGFDAERSLCAVAPTMRALVCARTYGHSLARLSSAARVSTCVCIAAHWFIVHVDGAGGTHRTCARMCVAKCTFAVAGACGRSRVRARAPVRVRVFTHRT
jgi:hypothetical protein